MAVVCGQRGDSRIGCSRQVQVVVCDEWLESHAGALEVLHTAGASIARVRDLAAVDLLSSSSTCGTAFVAVEQPLADGSSTFDVIERLHRSGFTVLGYADGVHGWSLARRCKFLLSGCSCVLDSAADSFVSDLRRALDRAVAATEARLAYDLELKQAMASHGVVGESRTILDVFASVIQIGPLSDLPILITGESGTGKELLARAIHARDVKRAAGPFVAVNCATIPATLAETELFGHRRGAFTGANRDRQGHFRAAQGGVLFLDEIAELETAIQVKLLRVLQDSRVTALGDEHNAPVSVRVIAATNGNLPHMVQQRTFRADLFHRLNVLSVHIPPVRDRRADIPPLVKHFVRKHQHLNPAASDSIGPDFLEALNRLQLPGNARQIENLVRAALVHNDGTEPLGLRDFPPDVWRELASEPAATPAAAAGDASVGLLEANQWSLSRTLRACERSFLKAALVASEGNQSKTARLLGITPRSVYNKLRRHQLS